MLNEPSKTLSEFNSRRREAIKSGSYSPLESDQIKLKVSDEKFAEWIKKYALSGSELQHDFLKGSIKADIYLGAIRNNETSILNALLEKDKEHREQFRMEFWEEYLYHREVYDQSTYQAVQDRVASFTKLKEFLDAHPEVHGITGDVYQNSPLYKELEVICGQSFSYRGWGRMMAAYMNSKEKQRLYHYMDYYM